MHPRPDSAGQNRLHTPQSAVDIQPSFIETKGGRMPPKAPKHDPRLAAVAAADGSIDRGAVEALIRRHPSTLTIAELEAMDVIFTDVQFREDNPVADVNCPPQWREAFVQVTGGTITARRSATDRSWNARFSTTGDAQTFRPTAPGR